MRVGAATVVSAMCGYAVLYLAARDLEPAGFSVFAVFWGAFGLFAGAANGLLQESTREVRQAHPRCGCPSRARARCASRRSSACCRRSRSRHVAAVVLARVHRVAGAERRPAGGGGGRVLPARDPARHAGRGGPLVAVRDAHRRRRRHAGDRGDDDVPGRLGPRRVPLGHRRGRDRMAPAPAGLAVVARRGPTATPGTTAVFLRGASHSIAAAGASAILIMGFPVLLKATSADLGAAGGVVILAVTLTRAPLLVPLTAMQGNLIAHFVDQRDRRLRSLVVPVAALAVLGGAAVLVAGLLGPWLLRTAFGPDYQLGGALLAWFTAAAVMIAVLTLTGAATVAAALHRAYAVGWISATLASTLLLLAPWPLETRTVVALLCGPLVGIAVHLIALARVPAPSGYLDRH